jgi:agmatinase
MEVVEVSPPYDVSDITSLLGGRVIMDVLATLVEAGKLGRPTPAQPEDKADDEELSERQPVG